MAAAADVGTRPLQPNVVAGGSIGRLSGIFWLLVIATGFAAGLAGGLLMRLLRVVQHLAWQYEKGGFIEAVQNIGAGRRVFVLLAAGLLAGVVAWWLAHEPGGHAGELAEHIWFGDGTVPFAKTVLRGCLSVVLVGLGASLGREAGPKQVGAAIAGALSRWRQMPPTLCRLLAACGAGAGMAAVYNVPVGGALFALEVLLGTLKLPLVPPVIAASAVATATSWLLLPNQPTYTVPSYHLTASLIGWAAAAGPVAGMIAVQYVRAISWADSCKPKGPWLLVAPLLVFALLGAGAVPLPQLLGNGRGIVQQAFDGQMTLGLLLALLVLKPLATCACLGSGAPGGLFTPTLCVGALMGGVLGQVWTLAGFGQAGAPCALIGAAAVLAASTQGPVSAVVLIVELTHHVDALVVPLLIAIGGATVVARAFEPRSIYSGRIHAGREVAEGEGTVSAAAGYLEVLQELVSHKKQLALRVLAQNGTVVGEITAEDVAKPGERLPLTEIATAHDLARSPGATQLSPDVKR